MNRYSLTENMIAFKREYFSTRIERIISLLELRNEVYLFENQNIFRHPSILEKLQKVPAAIKILNTKEKEWLKKNKDGSINTDSIYIFIADTLCSLYNNFPTNRNIKRAIALSFEILAIKIILNPIYKDKQKSDLEELFSNIKTKEYSNVEEIIKDLKFEHKLNPELNKFVKNWTRSITFDVKVKMNTFFLDIKQKLKKEKPIKLIIDKQTKSADTYLTREEMFENIAERLLEYALDNFWIEEFKFISARLIYKKPTSYAKVIWGKRVFENEVNIEEFKDRLIYLFKSQNTYLSSEYSKYNMLFPKGIRYGLKKIKEQRGVDFNTSRILIDLFLIETLRVSSEDKPYINYKEIENSPDLYTILFDLKPFEFIKFKLSGLKDNHYLYEHQIIGEYNLKEYINEMLKVYFENKKIKNENFHKDMRQVTLSDWLSIFDEYIFKNPKLKKDIIKIFNISFSNLMEKKGKIDKYTDNIEYVTLLNFIKKHQ